MVEGLLTGLGLGVLVLVFAALLGTGKRAGGEWWIDTAIGRTFGPFPSEEAATNYPYTPSWGSLMPRHSDTSGTSSTGRRFGHDRPS